MDELYPPESQKLDIIGHLEELRRRILIGLAVLLVFSAVLFSRARSLMAIVIAPSHGLVDKLIFISPTEVFVSYLKVAFLFGFIFSFPVILFEAWAFLSPAFPNSARRHVVFWLGLGMICFFGGIVFAYWIAIPAALKFLLFFGRGVAEAYITLAKYVSFFGAFIIVGGVVFEIPVVMGLLTDAGLLHPQVARQKRPFALVGILIVAAVITPTQDILNMLIFALPMIGLYEVGILISALIQKKRNSTPRQNS